MDFFTSATIGIVMGFCAAASMVPCHFRMLSRVSGMMAMSLALRIAKCSVRNSPYAISVVDT